jgi:hypothetical protein
LSDANLMESVTTAADLVWYIDDLK